MKQIKNFTATTDFETWRAGEVPSVWVAYDKEKDSVHYHMEEEKTELSAVTLSTASTEMSSECRYLIVPYFNDIVTVLENHNVGYVHYDSEYKLLSDVLAGRTIAGPCILTAQTSDSTYLCHEASTTTGRGIEEATINGATISLDQFVSSDGTKSLADVVDELSEAEKAILMGNVNA